MPEAPQLSRSQLKDAEARARLVPLAPGERPWPIVVSALVAFALGAVTLALYVAGVQLSVGGKQPSFGPVAVYSALMLTCAGGTWLKRYWAILGFQALLAIGLLGGSLALIKVQSVLWGAGLLIVLIAAGYLFWKLVRILSRIQMPTPPQHRR